MRVLVSNYGNTLNPFEWTDSEKCIPNCFPFHRYYRNYRNIHWDTGFDGYSGLVIDWKNDRSFNFAVFII